MATDNADVIVIGAGLAGLVAANELADAGRRVLILDQEGENSLGGQAFWSLGGLFMVDTPEQRRLGVKDSHALAWSDWLGAAQFDRPEDDWPRKTAEAYVDFASGEMRPWLKSLGMSWLPMVGWAERGGGHAHGHGNSVPRFHITWGAGPGVVEPFEKRVRAHAEAGRIEFAFRSRVVDLIMENGVVVGCRGETLAPDKVARGEKSNRDVIGAFEYRAAATLISSGGIGGNFQLFREAWPEDQLGPAPANLISGVPDHVDGLMIGHAERAGVQVINRDRLWCYTEGVRNWDPIWPAHGIRILPGPSPMWFDAAGERMEAPYLPGYDTRGTLKRILKTGFEHSWFIMSEKMAGKEIALSGSEQNPDWSSKSVRMTLAHRLGGKGTPAVRAFLEKGPDFVVKDTLEDLVTGMNKLTNAPALDVNHIRRQIEARDLQIDNPYSKDAQVMAIHNARKFRSDRLVRVAKPHKLLDGSGGKLVGIKLNVLTRKTLGGLHTDLEGRALNAGGAEIPGLFAAGEASGFGGGGYHGYNGLEGTFLGGCIFSGRAAGRAIDAAVAG
ncbi:MAG: FAD-binding dehydrogenase [Pseudomonadota bacterium]